MIGYRIVTRGRTIRYPIVEQASRLSLETIPIVTGVRSAYTKDGTPACIEVVATVRVDSDEPTVHNAIERFLGCDKNAIARIAKETIEGHLRGVAAVLTFEELQSERVRFSQQLIAEADHDMHELGLVLDTLVVEKAEKG